MLSIEILIPNAVSTIVKEIVGNSFKVSWTQPAITSYPVKEYEVWVNDALIATTPALTYTLTPDLGSTIEVYIVTLDMAGNRSLPSTTTVQNVVVPAPVILTGLTTKTQVIKDSVLINWDAPASTFPIRSYEVGYNGTTNIIGVPSGTTFTYKLPIGLSHEFYITAIDVLGNRSAPTAETLAVTVPGQPIISNSVIDNNVLLYWTDTTQTLPILTYEIHKGATYSSTPNIGTKTGLFTSVFETVAGTYTYWITAVDVAGNKSEPKPVTLAVSQPPDYILKVNANSDLTGTKFNLFDDGLGLLGPTNNTEQFEEHFTTTTHGGVVTTAWLRPQNQIDALFPIYIQPNNATGYYEEIVDYGTVLASSKVTITPTITLVSGTPTLTTDIYASLDGVTWSPPYSNTSSAFITNFRYIKYRLTITTTTNAQLLRINDVNVKLDQKLRSDAGIAQCLATDGGSAASATPTLSGGAITGFTGLVGGTGYSTLVPPSINITGNGTGAQVAAVVSGGAVTGFTILNGGSGYTTASISISGTGTVVPWNSGVSFTDITSLNVTPAGTANVIALYDFADIPNPAGFRILLLDPSTGTRVNGSASWNVKGY